VTVLVPTGTPFPADRRLEAERHHFAQKNRSGVVQRNRCRNLLQAHFATDGAAGGIRRLLQVPQPTQAAAQHPAEPGNSTQKPGPDGPGLAALLAALGSQVNAQGQLLAMWHLA
jgi:hypothetical protein